ncbi:sensor histidine kinase N-terminal domain-containing protein [Xiashengella succiniciproducens]|uniref:Sensor histidine kinase N-terminal domain-containing protein n=1 Tax=Xiashengella succiniciproducens TaxID=2949635 RepID=A0A9J6ZS10_9BACT|nr:sensor histidine kinase N-terminal domain-containing protein [Alkaliflexus sp. Ai-910]URW80363.1 sensor histidine kinase N-terminal domain-containing protein [Alkaliflexus sp. Ai-910]
MLFVIQGNKYEEFMNEVFNYEYVDSRYYTVMDPEGKFLESNKDIPRWIIESSVLIDSENKIKMVGAP